MSSPTSSPESNEDLLIAYVLDALEPDEIQQVSELLRTHPELRQTLAELRRVVAALPYGLPEATPHPDLRQRILQRATDGSAGDRPSVARRSSWLRPSWLLALSGALL